MKRLSHNSAARQAEQGFMLVGLIVAIFLILLVLGVAAPIVAKQLRREREVEAVHRGNQYVRAIRQYYLKTGHYPGSMDQLEKTNNIRFLRQRYVDPMTGKADWKLIHLGEAKTTVKAFFGQPLSGLPGGGGAGLGSAASFASNGQGGQPNSPGGSNGAGGSTFGSSSFGSSGSPGSSTAGSGTAGGPGSSTFGSSSFGASGSSGSSPGSPGSGSTGPAGFSSQSATSFTGTGLPIMGVGSAAAGTSIVVLNEQTTYPTWEFIYDPRIEQLKAKSSVLGGSLGSATASGFGSSATGLGQGTGSSGSTSGFGSSGTSGPGAPNSNPPSPPTLPQ